jgi:hypothetical protein
MLAELVEGAKRNPIWFGAVATITGVQGFFAWEFWGAASADPNHQLALRALGLGFVAGEVVALDMASRADLTQEHKRAHALRALWCVLALSTSTADINALSGVLREGDAGRDAVAAAYDARQARIAELEDQIDEADDPFDNELLSVAAYDAAIEGKRSEIATARAGRARMWRVLDLERQLTDLQTARAAAAEVDAWQADLTALRQSPLTHEERPATGAVEFAPFAEMLQGMVRQGQRVVGQAPTAEVRGEDVRAGMVWIATVAMKLMLTFGVWVGLQRGRGTAPAPAPAIDKPEPQSSAPQQRINTAAAPPQRPRKNVTTFSRRNQRFGR